MEYHEKTSSKDVARLMAALLLLVLSVGSLGYLVMRFGVNPMANQDKVTLQELLFSQGKAKDESFKENGQVAAAQDSNMNQFKVESVDISKVSKSDKTVEFVRANNTALLRYMGLIYVPQTGFQTQDRELTNADSYPWLALVNAPGDVGGLNDVFSYYSSPDTNNLAFVMRWGKNAPGSATRYGVYVYNQYNTEAPFRFVHMFEEKEGTPSVPKVSGMSLEGRYIALALFSCDACTEIPVTMVVDSVTGEYKMLGKTSAVALGDAGEIKYKEYHEIACPEGTPLDANGKAQVCAIDPQFLPFKDMTLE